MVSTKENILTDNHFLHYIRDIVPGELEAENPEAAGKAAEMIFLAEMDGEKVFQAENFANTRERASMCRPFQVNRGYMGKREHILDVIELCFHLHNRECHGVDNPVRIKQLEDSPMTEIEQELVTSSRGFWNVWKKDKDDLHPEHHSFTYRPYLQYYQIYCV